MATGTFSDYARHIQKSPAYVNKLKNKGRLVMREEGGRQVVDFDQSDRLVHNTTDLGRANNGQSAAPASAAAPAIGRRPAFQAADSGRVDSLFRQAQAQERAFAAKIEELKYRELSGELIRVDAIRSALAGMIAATRDSLLQIPARVAPVLAVETDAARVHDLIQAELHQALAQLVASPDRITRIETEH